MANKWGPIVIGLVVLVVLTGIAYRYRLFDGDDDEGFDGLMGIELTVIYEDGGSRVYAPENDLALIGINIIDNVGRPVQKLIPLAKYRANWDGTLDTFELIGSLKTYMDGDLWDTINVVQTTNLAKDTYKDVASITYTKLDLEHKSADAGDHVLTIKASLSLTIVFADGTTDTKSNSHSMDYKFYYQSGTDPIDVISMITEFSVNTYAYAEFR